MITQVFQSPSGGNWCGSAQNSNSHGSAAKALLLNPSRKASTSSGSAQASQAAPDFISCRDKVECACTDLSGSILA